MIRVTLYAISYSPWSQIAAWALSAREIPFQYKHYTPVLSEPLIRLRSGYWTGTVSMPIIRIEKRYVRDTFNILEAIDEVEAKGPPLLTSAAARDWVEKAMHMSAARRGCITRATANSNAALDESNTLFRSRIAKTCSRPIARAVAKKIARKYDDPDVAIARSILTDLTQALKDTRYLTGTFSAADIAMGVTMDVVAPPDDRYVKRGPHTRLLWADENLKRDFPEAIAWRDALYAQHHPRRLRA